MMQRLDRTTVFLAAAALYFILASRRKATLKAAAK
jgi:hypothetical protein